MNYTYNNLKRIQSIVVIPGDKDSAIVIMNKNDYVKKMQEMIDRGIQDGVYAKTRQNLTRLEAVSGFIV